jgi:antitoxin (DNA-binding transcriptional repressor) of toxin-antitoxin stability system
VRERAVSVSEARRSLPALLSQVVDGGESVVIEAEERPIARLVPVVPEGRRSLADVRGWLDDGDPFFAAVDAVVAARHRRRPRATGSSRRRR